MPIDAASSFKPLPGTTAPATGAPAIHFGATADTVRFSGKKTRQAPKPSFNPIRLLFRLVRSILRQAFSLLGLGKKNAPAKTARNTQRARMPKDGLPAQVASLAEQFEAKSPQRSLSHSNYRNDYSLRADQTQTMLDALKRTDNNNLIIDSDDEWLRDGFSRTILDAIREKPEIAGFKKPPLLAMLTPKHFAFFHMANGLPNDINPDVVRQNAGESADSPVVYLLDSPDIFMTNNFMRYAEKLQQQDKNVRFVFLLSKNGVQFQKNMLEQEHGKTIETPFDLQSDAPGAGFNTIHLANPTPDEWAERMAGNTHFMELLGQCQAKITYSAIAAVLNAMTENDIPLFPEETVLPAIGHFVQMVNADPNHPDRINADYVEAHKEAFINSLLDSDDNDGMESGMMMDSMGMMNAMQQQTPGSKPFTIINPNDIKVSLNDVVGLDKAKAELHRFIQRRKFPDWYGKLEEGDPDAGKQAILLYGPPGNGKTLIAKAAAKDLDATFINATSQLTQVYKGTDQVNADAIREAIKTAPTDDVVLFVDEFDGVGDRENEHSGSEAQITQWLQILEGLEGYNGKHVIFMAATNKRDKLDKGLFERFLHVEVPNPNPKERQQILENQFLYKKMLPDGDLDWDRVKKATNEMSGRNLRDIVTQLQKELVDTVPDEEKARGEAPTLSFTNSQLLQGIDDFKKSREGQKKGGTIGFGAVLDPDTNTFVDRFSVRGQELLATEREAQKQTDGQKTV